MSHRGHRASTAGTSTDRPQDWRKRAACRDAVDPEIFYPLGEPGSKKYEQAAQIAKALCSFCPVITDCLEDALISEDKWAIRGGLDPTERGEQFGQRWRKKRPAYPCNECGIGMGAPKNKGNNRPRYCSDTCRGESKKRRQAEYDQKRKAVAV